MLLAIHPKNVGNTTDSGCSHFKRLEVMPVTLETNITTLIIYNVFIEYQQQKCFGWSEPERKKLDRGQNQELDHLGYECSSNLADLADYSGKCNQRTNDH